MINVEIFKTGIAENVLFGKNCKVADNVNIYNAIIGDDCFIGPWVEIQNNVKIGHNTRIQSHSFICEGMKIGDNCFFGHGVMTANCKYPSTLTKEWKCEPPCIGSNVVIGSNATILPGVLIGDNAVIGAGVTVTKNVAPGEIFIGKKH